MAPKKRQGAAKSRKVPIGEELTLGSWNLLSPTLHESNRGYLDWDTIRLPALRSQLQQLSWFDILCFQELDSQRALEEVKAIQTANGFSLVLQQHPGASQHMLLAVCFKASRFRVAWVEHRSRVLLVGLQLPDGRILAVTNCHLQAGASSVNEAQRASQLTSALRRVRDKAPWAVVACGDFNSRLENESPLRAQLQAMQLQDIRGMGPTYAVCGYMDCLDHILVGPPLQGQSLHIVDVDRSTLEHGLPNGEYPSDHLPIGAVLHAPAIDAASSIAGTDQETSVPGEEWLREWCELTRVFAMASVVASPNQQKSLSREQRKLEASFLEQLTAKESAHLRAWRQGALEAACAALKDMFSSAVVQRSASQGGA